MLIRLFGMNEIPLIGIPGHVDLLRMCCSYPALLPAAQKARRLHTGLPPAGRNLPVLQP
jgi:hypothetical protein